MLQDDAGRYGNLAAVINSGSHVDDPSANMQTEGYEPNVTQETSAVATANALLHQHANLFLNVQPPPQPQVFPQMS
eukprot:293917-Amphidinium_carterae.1